MTAVPETAKWQIFSRYAAGTMCGFAPPFYRVALLDTFEEFTATLRFNDVGTWTMTLPYAHGSSLITDSAGIQVLYGDVTVFSGSVSHWEHEWSATDDALTVFGFTDDVWLSRRVAHQDPTAASPIYENLTQYATEYDVFSGSCEDALIHYMSYNIGPSALPERQFIGANPVSTAQGTQVVGRARMQNLLTLMQELAHAGGDCGFRVVHAGNGTSPAFEVYEPADLSRSVVFSAERGNLLSYKFDVQSPDANFVYLGVNQEAEARWFLLDSDDESGSVDAWGRIEKFQDARDIKGTPTDTDPPGLTETRLRAEAFLAENGEATAFEATITGTTVGARYPTDFGLGDIVGVELPEQSFDGVVRAVTIKLDATGISIGATIASEAGPNALLGAGRSGRTIRELHARTINLERR